MQRVALYARVSTDDQSLENQLLVLEQLCQQRNWQLIGTYQEQESAWKAGHQIELARLLVDARKVETFPRSPRLLEPIRS